MLRQPAVADRFYPGSAKQLERAVNALLPDAQQEPREALGVIAPHAGYIYSGELAGKTLSRVRIPGSVIILGPNHHGRGAPVAVSTAAWSMPSGVVPHDQEISTALIDQSGHIVADESAHQFEHSLEVQVPFLQALQPDLNLVPIAISHISYSTCLEVAQCVAHVILAAQHPVLLVASTDMSHYESRTTASRQDDLALQEVLALNPEGLYQTVLREQISMCGFIPVTILLLATKLMGARQAELVGYTDSGAVSGDIDQVVGYAGLVIS
jgi:AmmeMemoRadiSam system protein B